MKTVTVVHNLVTSEQPLLSRHSVEIRHFDMDHLRPVTGTGDMVFDPDRVVQHEVVPVHRICHSERPDMYLAISKNVYEALGVPVNKMQRKIADLQSTSKAQRSVITSLHKEIAETREENQVLTETIQVLDNHLSDWRNMSRWQRIKNVFRR